MVGRVHSHDGRLELLHHDLHEVAQDHDGVPARVADHVVDRLVRRHGQVGVVHSRTVCRGHQQGDDVLEVGRQRGLRNVLEARSQLADGEARPGGDRGLVSKGVLEDLHHGLHGVVVGEQGGAAVDALEVEEDLPDAPQRGVPHIRVLVLGGLDEVAEPVLDHRVELVVARAVEDGTKGRRRGLAPPPVLGRAHLRDVGLHKRHDVLQDVVPAAGGQQGDAGPARDSNVPDAVVALRALLLLHELRQEKGHERREGLLAEMVVDSA
mmetsp:Transcript_27625/g.65567  ORF Transcript_27625/g.65567 Transcript_27625/m.65567 type:complete len:266 (+) Transcript_27625:2045-2842(+)